MLDHICILVVLVDGKLSKDRFVIREAKVLLTLIFEEASPLTS